MSTASHYLNPATDLRFGYRLYRKLPAAVRIFFLSVFVFSAAVVASFAQSAIEDGITSHQPISASAPASFQVAAQTQPSGSGNDNSDLAATNASDAASQADQQPLAQTDPAAAAPAACATTTIPYQTTYVNDPKLPQGEQNVAAYGVNGSTVTCDGQAPQTTPPQNEVIHVGTYTVPAPAPDPATNNDNATKYCEALLHAQNTDSSSAMQQCVASYSQQ